MALFNRSDPLWRFVVALSGAGMSFVAVGCDRDPPPSPELRDTVVQADAEQSPWVEPVADEYNAWLIFEQAAQAGQTGVNSPSVGNVDFPPYPPFGDEWTAMATASEAAHRDAFRLARQARSLTQSMVRTELPATPDDLRSTRYDTIRHLADLLGDSAMHRHLQGDDVEAVGRLLDLLHLARSMRADPMVLSQLVAIGIDSLAASRTLAIAPGLRFDLQQTAQPVTRSQVRALINALTDDVNMHACLRHTLAVEQILALSPGWQIDENGIHQPMSQADIDRQGEFTTAAIAALETGNLPDALHQLHGLEADDAQRLFEVYYRNIAERRMAAVSLAVQIYRSERGEWPSGLDQLVPEYLPQIPADPFRADGAPIGYVVLESALPDGGDRPMVYIDSGDPDDTLDTEPMYGWQVDPRVHQGHPHRRKIRQYRDLSRWLPPNRRFDANRPAEAVE